MVNLKDEEFKIWEQDKIRPRKKSMEEIQRELMMRESEYYNKKYKQRRQNIRNGRAPMSGVLSNETVQNLFDLGEINFHTALKLDFFATLDKSTRNLYCDCLENALNGAIHAYLTANNKLGVKLMEFKTMGIFAMSALNNTRKLAMKNDEIKNLSKGQINAKRTQNYEKNWENYQNSMDHMKNCLIGHDFDGCNNITDLNSIRTVIARNVSEFAQMLDLCDVVNGGEGSLYFYGALTILRGCGLPRETLNEIKHCNKSYVVNLSQGFLEMSNHRGKSDLVVVDTTEQIKE